MTTAAASGNSGKVIAGCGGCGCASALLLLLAGVVCVILGTQPRTTEAMPVGIVLLVLSALGALVSLPVLVYGVMQSKAPPPPTA
jgi:hypothetical protein